MKITYSKRDNDIKMTSKYVCSYLYYYEPFISSFVSNLAFNGAFYQSIHYWLCAGL